MATLTEEKDQFRDHLATVDERGKRIWIYPKKPKGRFHNYRILVSAALLTVFLAGPFVKISGQPFLLINIFQRKFVIFGQVFWPQDFHIFGLVTIAFIVFVILFTVVFGRLFCGWACPQTIFMEMVFRKVEYWIEGDANRQRKLAKQPWNREKIIKRTAKHAVFAVISLIFTHTIMAYLIGIEQMQAIVTQPPSQHPAGFTALVAFTAAFYGVFAFLREQVCTTVCPYGRLQGVLLVKDSIVVAYDWLRGEPRGKIRKKEAAAAPKGDCVDCGLCVQVCPTGIDIRNGTQLECVNCTACIDACDEVMLKVNRPTGLIRYASANDIEEGRKLRFTWRVASYSAVLTLLLGVIAYLVASRTDIEATVLRVPGMTYQEQADGRVSNLYNIQFVNKTMSDVDLELRLVDAPATASLERVGGQALRIPAGSMTEGVFFVKMPREALTGKKSRIYLELWRGEEQLDEIRTNFMGPTQ